MPTLFSPGRQGPGEFPGAAPQVEGSVPGLRVPPDGDGQAGQALGRHDARALSAAWMVARMVPSIASVGIPVPPCTACRNAAAWAR